MDYSKFDAMVDVNALARDVETVAANPDRTFEKVPYGDYEVKVNKFFLGETKATGKPKVEAWFEILAGDYKGQKIFMHQVVMQPFHLRVINELMEAMIGRKVEFDPEQGYCGYAQTLEGCEAEVMQHEYALEFGERKGFDTFKITAVLE